MDLLRLNSNSISKSKISTPVMVLVGDRDPERKHICESLLEASTSITIMDIKGHHVSHVLNPKKISFQVTIDYFLYKLYNISYII